MAQTEELLASVEKYRDEMIKEMSDMLSIPAMGPENGGQGEFERARFIEDLVRRAGFTDVQRYEALDPRVKLEVRPSIIAKRKGKSPRTVWIVSHMDTVSPGDEKAWTYPPFQGTVVDGKLYGRGSEDNGQAVISSVFAARALLDTKLDPDLTVGLAIVADEEAGSDFGIKYLIKEGLFGKDDLFYVPDSGEPDGSMVEVAEKSIIWLQITVHGKQIHASIPQKGINALTTQALLKRNNMRIEDIDLFEHNEAFATASVAVKRTLGVPEDRFNVNGGAVALGHPIGCSGARVLTTLIYALQDRGKRTGLATLCLGGGNAVSMIVRRE